GAVSVGGLDPVPVPLTETFDEAQTHADGKGLAIRLKGALPAAVVDVDRPEGHAAVAGVLDDRGGRVKPHWLGVEQGAGELDRIMAFEPGPDVADQCKAGAVSLRKAVRAETLDLFEDPLGKLQADALCQHAADQALPVALDVAGLLPGR